MSERNKFIKALAEGNAEAYAEFDRLPSHMKIGFSLAVEDYKNEQGQGKQELVSDDELALVIASRLKDSGIKEAILERQKAEEEATKARQQEINEKINGNQE
jgi:hypothetical protein